MVVFKIFLLDFFVAIFRKTGIIMPSVATEGEKINIISSPNHNAPSIIMFGWTGSTDRYLSKYGKIHENQG
jgi:hypothetical protein